MFCSINFNVIYEENQSSKCLRRIENVYESGEDIYQFTLFSRKPSAKFFTPSFPILFARSHNTLSVYNNKSVAIKERKMRLQIIHYCDVIHRPNAFTLTLKFFIREHQCRERLRRIQHKYSEQGKILNYFVLF